MTALFIFLFFFDFFNYSTSNKFQEHLKTQATLMYTKDIQSNENVNLLNSRMFLTIKNSSFLFHHRSEALQGLLKTCLLQDYDHLSQLTNQFFFPNEIWKEEINEEIDNESKIKLMLQNVFSSPRNYKVDETWRQKAGDFITVEFGKTGLITGVQTFQFNEFMFLKDKDKSVLTGINIFALYPGSRWGSPEDKPVIIGAHWDTTDTTPGSNDNGSGVVALLELAQTLHGEPRNSIILVAFDMEEMGIQGSLYFVERFLLKEIMIKFGIQSLGGVFILDTILNYNVSISSQTVPETWYRVVPEVADSIQSRGYRGDFLALYQREGVDNELAELFTVKWNNHNELGHHLERVVLNMVRNDDQDALKHAEFLRSDHSRFWFTKNREIPSIYGTVLLTDTGPLRGRMRTCYHRACDTFQPDMFSSNLHFYIRVIDVLRRTVIDLADFTPVLINDSCPGLSQTRGGSLIFFFFILLSLQI